MQYKFWDKIWKDKHGHFVIWQKPNLPLSVWLIGSILIRLLPIGDLTYFFRLIVSGALFIWALMELFSGVNYFRRGLGLTVLALMIFNALK